MTGQATDGKQPGVRRVRTASANGAAIAPYSFNELTLDHGGAP